MEFKEVIEIVNTECNMQGRCNDCYLQNVCNMCDAVLPQVLRELQGTIDMMNDNEYKAPPKCPICGSSAQVKQDDYFTTQYGRQYKQYVCGCSCRFIVNN